MKNRITYSDTEWEEIASYLSGESSRKSQVTESFLDSKGEKIENYFKMTDFNRGEERVDVDKAWDSLYSKLSNDKLIGNNRAKRSIWAPIYRVAAILVILIATTFTIRFILKDNTSFEQVSVITSQLEKNRVVELPDGSIVTLNRDSEILYPSIFEDDIRKVELRGEAFFDIISDATRPFVIDAGRGEVRVLGTSFNVITDNQSNQVEVFVETGKVLLSDNRGEHRVTLEPGYIGKTDGKEPTRELNSNPNYMSWNTEILTYDGTSLDQVFSDLKRVHNISVEVVSDSILDMQLTTEFNHDTPQTIIKTICTSFSLTFEKEGEIYYLSK